MKQIGISETMKSEQRVFDDMVLLTDRDTLHILYANQTAALATGYSQDELCLRSLLDLYPAAWQQKIREMIQQLQPQANVACEHPLVARDGSLFSVETHFDLGHIHGIPCVVSTIRTVQPETCFQSVFQVAPIGIVIFDQEGRVTHFNPAHVRLTGLDDYVTPGEFIGMSLLDNPTVEHNGLRTQIENVLAGRAFTQVEPDFVTRTDQTISIKIFGVPLLDAAGNVTGGFLLVDDISERVQIERKLESSEARLRSLVLAIPDMMFRLSKDGTYLDYIPAKGVEPAFPPSEFLGKRIDEVPLTDDTYAISTAIRAALETGQLALAEYQVRTEDGPRSFEARIVPNDVDEVLAVIRDITEQRRYQERLETSENRYRTLVNAIPDLLFHIRRDGLYLDARVPKGLGIVELEPENIIGKNVRDIVPLHVTEAVMPAIERVITTRQPEAVEYQIEEPTGLHYYEARFVVHGEDTVLAVVRDMTKHRHALDAVRDSEQTARALLNVPTHMAILVDTNLIILAVNDLTAHAVGKAPEELIGTSILDLITPENLDLRLEQASEVIHTCKPLHLEHKHQDGDYHTSVYPLFDIQGHVTRLAILTRDVTQQIQAEEMLRRRSVLLEGAATAANTLLSSGDSVAAINKALAILGRATQADQIAIFEIYPQPETGKQAFSHRFDWTQKRGEGPNNRPEAQNLVWEDYAEIWLHDLLAERRAIGGPAHSFPGLKPVVLEQILIRSLMLVPIFIDQRFWGILELDDRHTERRWSPDETSALQMMAASVGAAIKRQQHDAQLRHEREVADTLREVGIVLNSSLDRDEVLGLILDQAHRVVPYDAANVMLIQDGIARIALHRGYEIHSPMNEQIANVRFDQRNSPILRHMIETREPYVCSDTYNDPKWIVIEGSEWIRSWLGTPIVTRDNKVVGLFSLDSTQPGFYTDEHVKMIIPFARQAAIAFENAQLYEHVQALYYAGRSLLSTLEPDEVLKRFAKLMTQLTDSTSTIICTVDPASQTGTIQMAYLNPDVTHREHMPQRGDHIQITSPALQQVLQEEKTLVLTSDQLPAAFPNSGCFDHACQVIIMPLYSRKRIRGIAILRDSRPEHIHIPKDLSICEALANLVTIALAQTELFAEVQALEHIKSAMIRMASHDLRNPLARLQTTVHFLEDEMQSAPLQNHFGRMTRAIREIEEIIDNILSLERIEAQYHEAQPILWCDVIEHALEPLQDEAKHKNHLLTVNCQPDLPVVEGDPAQIERAVANLVNNAIKYTPPGGKIMVRAYLKDYGGTPNIAIEVEDTGIGIPRDKQEKLFQPFFRAKQVGTENIPGIGLGLSVVKAAVDYHQGRAYFDSEPGQGSLFGFRIPVQSSKVGG
jgi:PAS domain S-box-containing protein